MKPSLALATTLLAASGAVQAQSGVSLFVLLDVNVSHYRAGGKTGVGALTTMTDGTVNGLNGSRWGVRATEDLGDGLKAGVLLEGGVLVDTGTAAQGGRAFGRQSFVSLAAPAWGEVRLGRQYVLSDAVVAQGNPFGNALVHNPSTSVTNMGRNLPMFLNAPRADNVLQYQTPTFSGMHLAGQIGPGEAGNDRFHGLRAAHAAGPLYVGVAYEWNQPRHGGGSTNQSLSASANYNFGRFKLLAGLQRNRHLTTTSGNGAAAGVSSLVVSGPGSFAVERTDGITVGAEVPMGGLTTVGVNYTRVRFGGTAGASADLGKLALSARHALSRNTFVYAGVSVATGGLRDYIQQARVVEGGIRTAF